VKVKLDSLKESANFYFFGVITLILFSGEEIKRYLTSFKLFPLWCNGILCGWHLRFVHPTCCYCRQRRRFYGRLTKPPYWIFYTYTSRVRTFQTTRYVHGQVKDNGVYKGGVECTSQQPMTVTTYHTCTIDPRGHFTTLRCHTIMALDKLIMKPLRLWIPIAEICEILANYPTW
jgi:hypothetical protein